MSDNKTAQSQAIESNEALFDIVVQLGSGSSLERVKDKALNDLGMDPLKVEALIRALQSGPSARIGASVPKSRADKAKEDFTRVGLKVTLNPVLSISKLTDAESDGKEICPACDVRVVLPENRQCPNCHVFVDKIDEEFLLRKKLMQQERRRVEMAQDREKKALEKARKEAMERELREQIRKQIEKEMGISSGKPDSKAKIKMAVAAMGLAGVAFVGGQMLNGGGIGLGGGSVTSGDKKAAGAASGSATAKAQAAAAKPADIDQIMQNLPSTGSLDPASAELLDDAAQEVAMLKMARNGGPDAKGIPLDKALAASMTLAEVAGNTTAQRALSGASGVAGAAPGGTASAAAFTPAALPADYKPLLALEFADQLAQMGQSARARGIVREIQTQPNPTPAVINAGQVVDVSVSAWGLSGATAEKSRKLMESVTSGVSSLRDPVAKAKAASIVAIAVAAQSRSPEQTAQAFLSQAAQAAGQISDAAQMQAATDELLLATGRVLLSGLEVAARAGFWERATDLSNRLQASAKQSRTAVMAAQLMSMVARAKRLTTADGSDAAALDAAVAEALKANSPAEKAQALQGVIEVSGANAMAATPAVLKALQTVETQALQANGLVRVQALAAMSSAYSAVGDEVKAKEMRNQLASTTGVQPAEHQLEMAKTLVRSETALAKHFHRVGAFAQSESALMRAASYLFKVS